LGGTVIDRFFQGRLEKSGKVTIPLLPTPMDRFEMCVELHQPSTWTLPTAGAERTERIEAEARQVYEKMTGMLSELTR
jgi:hypothetical protein